MTGVAVFGDVEPEDAWHPADPIAVLVDNVSRRCADLGEPPGHPPAAPVAAILEDVAVRAARILTRTRLSDRDLLRAELIAYDVGVLRTRLESEPF